MSIFDWTRRAFSGEKPNSMRDSGGVLDQDGSLGTSPVVESTGDDRWRPADAAKAESTGEDPWRPAADAAVVRGDRCRDQRDWQGARAAYAEAVKISPRLQPIWIQMGHAAKESGDLVAAELAYRTAQELNPDDAEPFLQLGYLMKRMGRLPAALEYFSQATALDHRLSGAHAEITDIRAQLDAGKGGGDSDFAADFFSGIRKIVPAGTLSAVFEVSDLMSYFRGSRLPTGIQRVQMEVIKSVIETDVSDFTYSIVCFSSQAQFWVEIPKELFLGFTQGAVSGGDTAAREWVILLAELDEILADNKKFGFPTGSVLVDLGTSWWQRNYFLNLRLAKSMYAVKYVPFVHDLIPVMTPEYCSADLRRDFLAWMTGIFNHADFFLANSQATAADLRTVAAKLGYEIPAVTVVTLNADFRGAASELESGLPTEQAAQLLAAHDLKRGEYVLDVATIEARKNHVAAFSVWLKLIKKHGIKNLPKLVCVGKDGWLNGSAYEMLRASEILAGHVLILHKISDAALAVLYQNCRCTLYPSFYEGWGLPVTEALCYGKIPIVSNISSLPEAGGEYAEYFDIESEKSLLEAVERVVFDNAYRTERENKIATEFRARSWLDICDQIIAQLKVWNDPDSDLSAVKLPSRGGVVSVKAETGVVHFLGSGSVSLLWAGLKNGEVYRNGRAWSWTENWGCWTKKGGAATVAFVLEDVADSEVLIYLGLKAPPGKNSVATIKCEGARTREVPLVSSKDHVITLDLAPESESNRLITVNVSTHPYIDLNPATGGADKRVIGVGVCWFYACKKNDLAARIAIVEALAMGDFWRLAPQPPANLDYFLHT